MNELQFIQYKHELRLKEKDSGKILVLATYACFIYMLFASFSLTGKMLMSQSYVFLYTYENLDLELDEIANSNDNYLQYNGITLANVEWFVSSMVAPISLPLLPHLIGKMKFRFILLIASIGPIIFLLPSLYISQCFRSNTTACDVGLIYFISILTSIIGGIMQSVLLFGMLYYISNIANKEEKVIYYGTFYFIHQFEWLIGGLIGDMLVTYVKKRNNYFSQIYIILIISQAVVCLFYMTLPEESTNTRFTKYKNNISTYFNNGLQQEKQKDQRNQLRELLLSQSKDDEEIDEEDELNQSQNAKQTRITDRLALMKEQHQQINKSLSYMTLQCFSIEEEGFYQVLHGGSETQRKQFLTLQEYEKNSYVGNLLLTWNYICEEGFVYMVMLILNVALIEAFLMLYFGPYQYAPKALHIENQMQIAFQSYIYVGIGALFGSFGLGVFGDFKDKIRGLYFQLGIFQFGCVISWSSYYFQYEVLILIFACCLGFTYSGMVCSVVSFQMCEFSKLIYLIDLMYVVFCISYGFSSLLYIVCNYCANYIALIFLQVFGILSIFATFKIKNNQILRMKLSNSD